MIKKFMHQLKLLIIVVLSTLLLALVEIAPDKPIQSICIAAGYTICIRLLWKSMGQDEKKASQIAILSHNSNNKDIKNNRAA